MNIIVEAQYICPIGCVLRRHSFKLIKLDDYYWISTGLFVKNCLYLPAVLRVDGHSMHKGYYLFTFYESHLNALECKVEPK